MIAGKISGVWRETWQCLHPLAIVALLFVTMFLLSEIPRLSSDACTFASALSQSAIGPSKLACFEFFLNRYQTLVGVAGALVAAAIAAAPVWRQVKLSGMQAALQLQPVIEKMEQEIGSDFELLGLVDQIEIRLDRLEFLASVAAEEGAESAITARIHKDMREISEQINLIGDGKLQRFFVARLRLEHEIRLLRSTLMETLLLTRKALLRPVPSPTKSSQEMIDAKFCTRLSERLAHLNGEISKTSERIKTSLQIEQEKLRESAASVQRALSGF